MTAPAENGVKCANDGCPRPPEAGERWCSTCGLERSLYRRDARRPMPAPEFPERPGTGRR